MTLSAGTLEPGPQYRRRRRPRGRRRRRKPRPGLIPAGGGCSNRQTPPCQLSPGIAPVAFHRSSRNDAPLRQPLRLRACRCGNASPADHKAVSAPIGFLAAVIRWPGQAGAIR
ncbi:hypothetical protein J4732_14725 [Serratia marcescens]|uniref:Uncharacterized protein n=1 Tax=Serratia marcescens TaxID=615 RepID=A0A939NQ44_SERMA|nr:hypothetical protein [Serratia marcescens]